MGQGQSSAVKGASGEQVWKLGQKLMQPVGGKRVLELGAGGGTFAKSLVDKGAHVLATDIKDQWQFPEIPFQIVDADEALPFLDQEFDAVCMLEAFNYVDSIPHICREAARVLKPGGIFVATFPNCLTIESRLKFLLTGTYRWFPHMPYPRLSKQEYSDVGRDPVRITTAAFHLCQAGFQIDEVLFGGSQVSVLHKAFSMPLHAASWFASSIRRPERRLPAEVACCQSLWCRTVGFRARKPAADGAAAPCR